MLGFSRSNGWFSNIMTASAYAFAIDIVQAQFTGTYLGHHIDSSYIHFKETYRNLTGYQSPVWGADAFMMSLESLAKDRIAGDVRFTDAWKRNSTNTRNILDEVIDVEFELIERPEINDRRWKM